MFVMIVLLGAVVSLDGFAAALSYGIQRIRLSPLAVLVISLTSASVIWLSMSLGHLVSALLPPQLSRYLGAGLLVVLGCYLLYQHSRSGLAADGAVTRTVAPPVVAHQPIAQINLRVFGLVIQILKQPALADRDQSGVISWQESILLGIALALDASGAGLGAAMTGLPALATASVAGAMKLVALISGWELGYRLQHKMNTRWIRLPGVMLICLGLLDLIRR